MWTLKYIAVLLTLFVCYAVAQTQIDGCLLSDLTDSEVTRLINEKEKSGAGEGNTVNVTLLIRVPNCRAIGRTRATGERYRSITESVRYTNRPPELDAIIVAQIDFQCQIEPSAGVFWAIPSRDEALTRLSSEFPPTALFDPSNLMTDCAECSSTVDDSNPANDQLFHCTRCDASCLEADQRLCYGDTSTTCCNVYVNDVCMNECPPNLIANSGSDFECFCNLACLNGGSPNAACDSCDCPDVRHTGPRCEDPCEPNPCLNGDCSPSITFPDFTCLCNNGFAGRLCNETIDPCDGVTCSNNGVCVPVGFDDFECNCNPGFTDDLCQTPIDPCDGIMCLNGGVCVSGSFPNFSCQCLPNFSGDMCQNCDLPNCNTCSQVEGICTECFGGYLLTQGLCMVDCSICDQRESQPEINICHYYCHQQHWAEQTSSVDFNFQSFSEPDRALPVLDKFLQMYSDSSSSEDSWITAAASTSEALRALQPPTREGLLLSEWIAASRVWVSNLDLWIQDIRRVHTNFPVFDFEPFLNMLDNGDTQGAYENIIDEWKVLLNQYLDIVAES